MLDATLPVGVVMSVLTACCVAGVALGTLVATQRGATQPLDACVRLDMYATLAAGMQALLAEDSACDFHGVSTLEGDECGGGWRGLGNVIFRMGDADGRVIAE